MNEAKNAEQRDRTKARVLVIEQNGARAALVADTLKTFGAADEVHIAEWCGDGFAKSPEADIVVCGHGATRQNRWHLLDNLLDERAGVPVIYLAPADDPDAASRALEFGASDAVVCTPGYLDQLPLRVTRVWNESRRGAAMSRRVAGLAETVAQIERDNAELKRLLAQFQAMAATDALTGLPNRRALNERLEETVSLSRRLNADVGVLMIDLDGFKLVNDTLGHEIGDELLRAVAVVLRQVLRRSDVPARLGGDEFVVVMPHTSAARAANVAARIQEQFARFTAPLQESIERARTGRPIVTFGRAGELRASSLGMTIGVASLSAHADADGATLLSAADRALYHAKSARRGGVVIEDEIERQSDTTTFSIAA